MTNTVGVVSFLRIIPVLKHPVYVTFKQLAINAVYTVVISIILKILLPCVNTLLKQPLYVIFKHFATNKIYLKTKNNYYSASVSISFLDTVYFILVLTIRASTQFFRLSSAITLQSTYMDYRMVIVNVASNTSNRVVIRALLGGRCSRCSRP